MAREYEKFETLRCGYCGGDATHYCAGCGKWICDGFLCKAKGAAVALGVYSGGSAKKNLAS